MIEEVRNNIYHKYLGSPIFFIYEGELKLFNPLYCHNIRTSEDDEKIVLEVFKDEIVISEKIRMEDISFKSEMYYTDFYNTGLDYSLFSYQKNKRFDDIKNEFLTDKETLIKYLKQDSAYKALDSEIFNIEVVADIMLDIKQRAEKTYEENSNQEARNREEYKKTKLDFLLTIKENYVERNIIDIDAIKRYYKHLLIEEPHNIKLYETVFQKLKNDVV